MKSLEELRYDIDNIDKDLINLFEKRMKKVSAVARYKYENNLEVFHKDREEKVIEKNIDRLNDKELTVYAKHFLWDLMKVSREYQKDILNIIKEEKSNTFCESNTSNIVGFQGEEGSFSEEAVIAYFKYPMTKKFEEFEDVFIALDNNEINYGVLPIENSSTGTISEIYDLLLKYNFYIVGEKFIDIKHNLLGLKGAKQEGMKEIYSHEQGFKQCSQYLKSLRNKKFVPYHNTAISAKYIKEQKDITKGAIASKRAAEIYNLQVIKEDINNMNNNKTRFIVISKQNIVKDINNSISFSFSVSNNAGTLFDILKIFANENINMTKIESRPLGEGDFSYVFYSDIDGNVNDSKIKDCLKKVKELSYNYKYLGCYKKDKII